MNENNSPFFSGHNTNDTNTAAQNGNAHPTSTTSPNAQGNIGAEETQSFSTYPGAHTTSSFQPPQAGQATQSSQNPTTSFYTTRSSWYDNQHAQQFSQTPAMASEPKKKRSVGLTTALALSLVAAISAGTITGVYVAHNTQSSDDHSNVVANLKQSSDTKDAKQVSANATPGSVEAVSAKVLPSVVSIRVTTQNQMGEGSGSIISEDGYVLTNNHVIDAAKNTQAKITVSLNDGTEYDAELVAGDPNTDVAVIKMKDASGLPTISFGDSDSVAVGQEVVAVGSPLGLSATVTSGIVSALNRPVRAGGTETGQSSLIDAIQTDAAINMGNSGGPLVDMNGNIIGMNSVIASTSTASNEAGSIGIGFAIPANFARRVATQLIETGQATQPMIGIQVLPNSPVAGAVIAEVSSGGPGEKAKLKAGEIITAMNGKRIDSADALIAAVRSSDFGEKITLTVADEQGNNPRDVELTLTSE
ncbi:S1C family serine protease [Corynebacterium sp. sy039]|uniref:S1C family serine protease n=1 Tax=Corynebacterium sp. sy039 TaxID=2599641 RepID=UPI0011B81294|nr:trypsin-like peptidase domain-containing protein [Corynebacterium sp. sy039]QDZ42241.1 trypsin-like serine protease [Corynebacterium sp. sy039]